VSNATPQTLYPRERPGTHCTGGWVGLRVGLDRSGKSRPPPGFDPRTVQRVDSRYTDYAIPAQENSRIFRRKKIKKYCNEHSKAENDTPASTYGYTLHIGKHVLHTRPPGSHYCLVMICFTVAPRFVRRIIKNRCQVLEASR